MKTCVLLYNPVSGNRSFKSKISEIEKILQDYEYKPNIIQSMHPGHIEVLARSRADSADLLISAGGDGTFNEAVRGILSSSNPSVTIGHLPCGTMNDLGKTFGLSKNISKALIQILEGENTTFDIPRINKLPFTYVVNCGMLSTVPYKTDSKFKKLFGASAYRLAALPEILKKTEPFGLNYEVNGRIYNNEFLIAIISNSSGFAGFKDVYNEIALNDGKVEMVLVENANLNKILPQFSDLLFQKKKIEDLPSVHFYKSDNIKLKFEKIPVEGWCIDGDKGNINETEVKIEVVDKINLSLPKEKVKTLFKKQ